MSNAKSESREITCGYTIERISGEPWFAFENGLVAASQVESVTLDGPSRFQIHFLSGSIRSFRRIGSKPAESSRPVDAPEVKAPSPMWGDQPPVFWYRGK